MQRLFNVIAIATILILLGVIFIPRATVSAMVKSQVGSMSEIDAAIDGYVYDRLSYDDTYGIFKIHYGCGVNLCVPKEIQIPVDLSEVTVQ